MTVGKPACVSIASASRAEFLTPHTAGPSHAAITAINPAKSKSRSFAASIPSSLDRVKLIGTRSLSIPPGDNNSGFSGVRSY